MTIDEAMRLASRGDGAAADIVNAAFVRLRAEAESVVRMFPCPCEPAWRDRDMHSPNCVWVDLDDLRDALGTTSARTSDE